MVKIDNGLFGVALTLFKGGLWSALCCGHYFFVSFQQIRFLGLRE